MGIDKFRLFHIMARRTVAVARGLPRAPFRTGAYPGHARGGILLGENGFNVTQNFQPLP